MTYYDDGARMRYANGSRMSKVHTVSEDLLESNCKTRCLSTNVSSSRRQCGFDAFSLCSG